MVDVARLEPLRSEVNRFQRDQWRRHVINFRANWILVVLAIGSTALVILGGVFKWSHEAIALIGVAGSIIVGLQAALAIEDKSEFQRVVSSDAENIQLCLSDPSLTEVEFLNLRDRFMALRLEASKKLPRGGGVEAARKLPPPSS